MGTESLQRHSFTSRPHVSAIVSSACTFAGDHDFDVNKVARVKDEAMLARAKQMMETANGKTYDATNGARLPSRFLAPNHGDLHFALQLVTSRGLAVPAKARQKDVSALIECNPLCICHTVFFPVRWSQATKIRWQRRQVQWQRREEQVRQRPRKGRTRSLSPVTC